MTAAQLPHDVFRSIVEFLAAEKTGQITLNVRCGEIEQWSLSESHRRKSQRRGWVDSGGSGGVVDQ